MFNVTIPSFKSNGVHRKVLELYALALIRHDAEVIRECGPMNRVSYCLREAAKKANITDSRFPLLPPDLVIVEWGKIIQADYTARLEIVCLEAEGELDTAQASTQHLLSKILTAVHKLSENQDKMLAENAGLKAQVISLNTQVGVLKFGLNQANERANAQYDADRQRRKRMRDAFESPDPVLSQSAPLYAASANDLTQAAPLNSVCQEFMMETAHEEASADMTELAQLKTELSVQESQQEGTTVQPLRVAPLMWNHDANQKAKQSDSDSNMLIVDVLVRMKEEGCFYQQPDISKATIPFGLCAESNKTYVTYCLQLVEYICASNESVKNSVATLQDRSIIDAVEVRNAAGIVADACFDKIGQLDTKKVGRNQCWALEREFESIRNKLQMQ